MAEKISRNQRSGPRVKQKPNLCPLGHERTWVNIARRGRKNMQALCECGGYAPISNERQK